jgi:monoterpene epsilon-lactone hydrolase
MNIIQKGLYLLYQKPYRTDGKSYSPRKFHERYKAKEMILDQFRMVTIGKKETASRHILFFHGGAYISEANLVHRLMAEKFAEHGYRVTCLDYPMAPEFTADYTNRWIVSAYKKLLGLYPDDIFYAFGDSAGGGLALIFLMLLRDQGVLPVPKKCVVASPWLDVSMSNPAMGGLIEKDKLLSCDGLIYAGEKYAGELGTMSPYVSPIYGNLDGLGEILMFYSSKELLEPDCERFIGLVAKAVGTSITVHKAEGLFHAYIMLPVLNKSKEAFVQILAFLK